jgi:hypothetical protein
MDDAKKFLLSAMQTLKERFANPFIGAFVAAWCTWNFKIILVVLGSGKDWEVKNNYIFKTLMPHWHDWAVHGYLIPALIALCWIYIFPYVLQPIAIHHEKQLNKNRKKLLEATEQRTLKEEDAQTLREHVINEISRTQEIREKTFKTLDENINTITKLTSDLANKNESLLEKQQENKNLEAEKTLYEKQYELYEGYFNGTKKPDPEHFMEESFTSPKGKGYMYALGILNLINSSPKYLPKVSFAVSSSKNTVTWPAITKTDIFYQEVRILKANIPFDDEMIGYAFMLNNKKFKDVPVNQVITAISKSHGITRKDYALHQLCLHELVVPLDNENLHINHEHLAALCDFFYHLGIVYKPQKIDSSQMS